MGEGPIHSNFVTEVLSRADFAREFFALIYEPELLDLVLLETLKIEPGSFVDDHLRDFHSDVLFSIKRKNGLSSQLYVIFEHKSYPDAGVLDQIRVSSQNGS